MPDVGPVLVGHPERGSLTPDALAAVGLGVRLTDHPSAQAEAMLSVVPGISTAMARSLLAAFDNVAAVAAMAPDRPLAHPSIGRIRAERIAHALHDRYVAPDDRTRIPRGRVAVRGASEDPGPRPPRGRTAVVRPPYRRAAQPATATGASASGA